MATVAYVKKLRSKRFNSMLRNSIAKERQGLAQANKGIRQSQDLRRQALTEVLERIAAGAPKTELCRKIGISRQTLYDWLAGRTRPNKVKAKKLAALTGFPAEDFR